MSGMVNKTKRKIRDERPHLVTYVGFWQGEDWVATPPMAMHAMVSTKVIVKRIRFPPSQVALFLKTVYCTCKELHCQTFFNQRLCLGPNRTLLLMVLTSNLGGLQSRCCKGFRHDKN